VDLINQREICLKKLNIKVTYRSHENDILNDFFIPCFRNSITYKRGVGYFTSSFLAEAAKGIVEFIENDGHMYLIVSPKLTKNDKELIKKGYELRNVIKNALEREIIDVDIKDDKILTRVKNLIWMVANNKLDIKIALPNIENIDYLYHEKFGLFIDSDRPEPNIVAFSGSLNETQNGLISNYESIDVSLSWAQGGRERERVIEHNKHFDKMWNGVVKGLTIMEFPDAIKNKMIQTYQPEKPTMEPGKKKELFYYQENAINAWKDASYKGILSMATGSGKTFTAIKAIETIPNVQLMIVIVPSIALINQWEREIIDDTNKYIIRKVSSEDSKWKDKIKVLINALKYDSSKKACIISSIQTASKSDFQNIVSLFSNEKLALIVDEVHRSGAKSYQSIFNINAKYRLGLSATPERQWDDEGNQAIFDYFGPTIYEYTLSEAIKDDRLSKYYYYIKVVSLTDDEKEKFKEMSINILMLLNRIQNKYPNLKNMSIPYILKNLEIYEPELSNKLRSLYLKRIEIIKKSDNKFQALKEILTTTKLKKCLVYCNDLDHLEQNVKIIHECGFIPIEYSSDIKPEEKREKILDDFRTTKSDNIFLVAVKCLDEGVDIPACDSAILVSCSRSEREFIQRRGRVLRKDNSKPFATIYDIVVLPFTNLKEAYPLNQTEYNFISEELKRIQLFSSDALNKEDLDVGKMLNFYENYILK
jgi:superfamily II DNA or RNA helicase